MLAERLSRCTRLETDLAAGAEGVDALGAAARRHVESCLRCQALVAQHRRLRRGMRSLSAERVAPAAGSDVGMRAVVEGLEGPRQVGSLGQVPGSWILASALAASGTAVLAYVVLRTRWGAPTPT